MHDSTVALYELSRPYGGRPAADVIAAVQSPESAGTSFYEWASYRERVAYRLLDIGQATDGAPAILTLEARRTALERALADIDSLVREDGLDVLLVKGFALERLYPAGYRRHFGDIDLLVEDAAAAWQLIARLAHLGFEPEEPVLLFALPASAECELLAKLTRSDDGARVEVASGVLANGPLPAGMAWADVRRRSEWWHENAGLRLPGLEASRRCFSSSSTKDSALQCATSATGTPSVTS